MRLEKEAGDGSGEPKPPPGRASPQGRGEPGTGVRDRPDGTCDSDVLPRHPSARVSHTHAHAPLYE